MAAVLSSWEGRLVAVAALWASGLAVVGAFVMREASDGPPDGWRFVLLVFLVAPYYLALTAEALAQERPQVRAALLGAALVPGAWVSMLSYLTGLPAFALLIAAVVLAVRSIEARQSDSRVAADMGIAGGIAALWVVGFLSLFWHEDGRCASLPNGYACTSDVVTGWEAALSLALLAGAGALAAVLLGVRPRSRRASVGGR